MKESKLELMEKASSIALESRHKGFHCSESVFLAINGCIDGTQNLPYVILGDIEERESLIFYHFPALGILRRQSQFYISV